MKMQCMAKEKSPETLPPQIYSAMLDAMSAIGAVGKDQENKHFRYKFRGIDDVCNAVYPAFLTAGIVMSHKVGWHDTEVGRDGKDRPLFRTRLHLATTFYARDGSSMTSEAMGEAIDSSDKSYNQAMIAAFKYMLVTTFAIPTQDSEDADRKSPEAFAGNGKNRRPDGPPAAVQAAQPEPKSEPDGTLYNPDTGEVLEDERVKTLSEIEKLKQLIVNASSLNDLNILIDRCDKVPSGPEKEKLRGDFMDKREQLR